MEVLDAGQRVFAFADRHASKASDMLSRSDFGLSVSDGPLFAHEVQMMGAMWQLAASLVKEMTEPLKSIVNK